MRSDMDTIKHIKCRKSLTNFITRYNFVSDLRQVGGFLRFPPPIKLTATI